MSDELTYQENDEKTLIVFGNRTKFQKNINLMGGRWNSKKNGWVLPISNKNKLDSFIKYVKENGVPEIRKYHREDTDNDDSEDETPGENIEIKSTINIEDDEHNRVINNLLSRQLGETSTSISLPEPKPSEEPRRESSSRSNKEEEYRKREEEYRRQRLKKEEEYRKEKLTKEEARKERENNAKRKYSKPDPELYKKSFAEKDYYEKFNEKPRTFRKIVERERISLKTPRARDIGSEERGRTVPLTAHNRAR
jgi:hypothetical protein